MKSAIPKQSFRRLLGRFASRPGAPVAFTATLVAAVLLAATGARGQVDATWNVDANGNWSLGTNWSTNPLIPGSAAGDIARLINQITTTRTVTLDTNVTLGLLEIGDLSGGSSFTLAGSSQLIFNQDGAGAGHAILRKINDGGTDTISTAIRLDDTLEISVFDPTDNQVLLLSGIISDGANSPPNSGNTAILINNAGGANADKGITRFDGQNTFTGRVVVQSGTLRIEGDNTATNNSTLGALGAGNETVITQGGRLDLRDRDLARDGVDLTEIVRISGTGLNSFGGDAARGGLGALINTSGTAQLSHLALDGDATVGGYSTLTIEDHTDSLGAKVNGILDGGGFTLTKRGSNYLILDDTGISNFKTIDLTEGYLRIYGSTRLNASDFSDGGINVFYNPDAFSQGLGGTRTSDPYTPSTAVNGDYTGNGVGEARLEFYTDTQAGDVLHSANINLNRGAILRSGTTTAATPLVDMILSGTINLVGGSETAMNVFSIEAGSSGVGDDPGAMIISGLIDNTSVGNAGTGFTKRGGREMRITSDQSAFNGNVVIRQTTQNLPVSAQPYIYGITLAGSGALSALSPGSTITLERRSSLNIDNTVTNLTDRIHDDAEIILRNSYLHFTSNAASATTETIGTLTSDIGINTLMLNSRAGGAVDVTIDALNLTPGSVFQIVDMNTAATFGVAPGHDRVAIGNAGSLTLTGNASGTTDRAILPGVLGGVVASATPAAGRAQEFLDNYMALYTGNRFMTIESSGGVDYLRPLADSEFNTTLTAGDNWRVTGATGNAGLRDNVPNVASSIAVNSLFIDDQAFRSTAQDHVLIEPGYTLTIDSGMISFGTFGGSYSSTSNESVIRGGFLSMNGGTAFINNGMRWHDTDNDNITGNSAFIRSHFVNTDGLVKVGRNNVYLDTWNRFNTGSDAYVAEDGYLVARHNRALDGIARVYVSGSGNFLLDQGVDISGVDLWVLPSDTTDRTALRAENYQNSWRGDIILDTLDAGGSNEFRRTIITSYSDDALNIYGDIYTSKGLPGAQSATIMTDSDAWNDPFRISTNSSSSGTINLHGTVRDTSTGPLDAEVNNFETTPGLRYSNNYALSFEMTGHDEMNVNVFQQWEATGRLELDRGYFRIQYDPAGQTGPTEGFLTDDTRSRITPNAYWTRLALGQDGTATNTGNSHLMLSRPDQLLNYPHLYVYNDSPQGTLTLGGENLSGTVYVGSRDNSVSSGIQYASQGASPAERDLRFYQAPGGTMVINAQLDDESNESGLLSIASKTGLGAVRINDNIKGASDVQAWNVMAGTLEWAWRSSSSGNDRFARADGNDNGARLLLGGGALHVIGATDANRDQDLPGARFTLAPGGSELRVTAQNTRTTRLTAGRGAGTSFFRSPGSLLNVVEENNGGTSQVQFNASGSATGSFGSLLSVALAPWATYTGTPGVVDNFLTTDGSGHAILTPGATHTDGLAEANFAATHANVITSLTFTGAATPQTLRFNTDAVALDLDSFAMTVGQGGVLVTSAVSTGASLTGGILTSGFDANGNAAGTVRDLMIHNYGAGLFEIGSGITDNGADALNLVLGGTGITRLSSVNSYTGGTFLVGGTVEIGSDSALGASPGAADADNLYFNGGTLRPTQDLVIDAHRGITLGGEGATFDVGAGLQLSYGGIITSEANYQKAANGYARTLAFNPDFGDLIKTGDGVLNLAPAINNTYEGLTLVRDGTLRITTPGTANSSSTYDLLGTDRSWTDATIVENGATLEVNFTGTTSAGDWVNQEWLILSGDGHDGGGAFRTTGQGRAFSTQGQVYVDGATRFNLTTGYIYLANGGGYLASLDANPATPDNIIVQGAGNFNIYSNAPDWYGSLTLVNAATRLYNGAALPNMTSLTMERNSYFEIQSSSSTVDFYRDQLPDHMPLNMSGRPRLRLYSGNNVVFSGFQNTGTLTAVTGEPALQFDSAMDLSASLPGQTLASNTYAGMMFDEIVRNPGALVRFNLLDSMPQAWTNLADIKDAISAGWADSALGVSTFKDVVTVAVTTAPATVGGQLTSEAPNRAIVPGFLGGTRLPYINANLTSQYDDENYYARRAMTVDTAVHPETGDPLTILRPLKTSEFTTISHTGTDTKNGVELSSAAVTGPQDNVRLIGLTTDTLANTSTYMTGRRDSIVHLQEDLHVNSLSFEQDSYINDIANAGTGRGNTLSLDIGLGRTLTIDSGQIIFAATGVSDRGGSAYDSNRNQYNWSFIHGGDLDFNGQEAILVNNSLWHHYNTTDSVNAFRAADGDYSEAYIGSSIVNANGLTKGGAASIHLMMPNQINGPVNINYGSLYVRHDQALEGATEVNVNGGNFIVSSGASLQGADIHFRLPDADRIALQLEQASVFQGNLVIHNVDSAGTANVNNAGARALLRSINSVGAMEGNIYGSDDPISNLTLATQPRLVSTNGSGANGTLWFRGIFSDKWDPGTDSPVVVDPNVSPNEVLRFEITGNDTFQLWIDQPWQSAGRIEHERGYVRYLGTGNFWSDEAAALLDSSNPVSSYVMGGDTATGNAQVGLLLTKDGQRFNIPSWQIGDELSNTTGNITLGGGNTSGTVSFGTGAGAITFYNRSASYDRDLTLVAPRGGEVEIDANLVDGGANVSSSITKIRSGTVLLNGSSAGPGTVEGVNVMGGVLVLQNYGTHNDRRIGQGAYLTGGGGALALFNDAAVSPSEDLTGAVKILPGASAVAVVNANTGTSTLNLGSFTRNAGGAMVFIEQDAGFGSAVLTSLGGAAQPAGTRIGSWASYGNQVYNLVNEQVEPLVSHWAAYDGSSGITAFSNYIDDGFGAGLHTNLVSNQLLGAATNTASLRFGQAAATQIDLNGSALTLGDGGLLVASGTGASSILDGAGGGSLVSGTGELVIHNYGSDGLTIAADIGGAHSFTHAGTGTTTLSGTNTYTGTSYLNQGTVVVDSLARLGSGALYLGGATLRHTGTGTETITRNITLGDSGAVIQLDDPNLVLASKVTIASEANAIASYTVNPLSGSLDITGSGTFTLGDSTAASNVTDVAGVNNTYQGLTVIGDGVNPTKVRVEAQPGDYTYVTPFGAPDTFLNSTQIRNNATLAFSPKLGDGSRDNEVRYREWLVFGENPADTTYLVKDTNRTVDLIGVITVNGTLDVNVSSNTLRFGAHENGYLIGDANSVIRKTGTGGRTLEVRESSPEFKGSWEIREGNVYFYGIGTPAGTGTAPIILGDTTGVATGLNRLWLGSEYGSNDDTNYNGMVDELNLFHDIVITGASGQDHRIGSGSLPSDGATVTFNGDIDIQSNLSSSQRAFYMEYEDTEGLSDVHTGHLQHVYINYFGDITNSGPGAGGFIEAYMGAGSANDDHDMFVSFVLGGNNTGWNGELRISNNTGATYDRDENVILRLANNLALDADNVVRMRNQSALQLGGQTVIIGGLITESGLTGDPSGAGFDPQTSATNLITGGVSAIIENASTTPGTLTIAQNNTASAVNWNALFRDGPTEVQYDPLGSTPASLSIVKTGAGTAVMTVGNYYTGTTTLDGGTLQLAYGSDNSMLSDTAALILNDGTLDLAGTVAHSEVVGSTTLNGTVAITRSAGSSVINLNTITRNAGSLSFSEDNIATTDNLNANGILGGWATVGGSWASNATNSADGFIVGLNTFDQNVDRLAGGAGVQNIADGSTHNVRIVEDGSTTNSITMAASGATTINTLLQSATGGEAVVDIGAGNILRIASGGVLLPDGSTSLTFASSGSLTAGSGDDTAGTLFLQNQDTSGSEFLTVGATIADNGSGVVNVRTAGPGTTIFIGAHTYTGGTLVGSGTLSIGDGGTTGTLGGGTVTVEGSGILAFNRSDTGLNVTNHLLGSGTVIQSGTGKTTLSFAGPAGSLNYVMGDGTLATGVDNAINTTGTLLFGATYGEAVKAGALDLTGGSAMVGRLLVQTNSTSVNQLTIGTGETLTVNGNVTVGVDLANSTDTALTVLGDGAFVVNQPGGTLQVGGGTGSVNGNRAVLDMSGLSSFTAHLGVGGVFRVGDNNSNSSGGGSAGSTVTLADTSTVTANYVGIGDRQGIAGGIQTLKLGSVANTLNADVIHVGDGYGQRGSGLLQFDAGTGTLQVRALDGTGRADFNVVNSPAGTGYAFTGTADLTGHASDLLLNTLTIGSRSAGSGGATGTFSFDSGTLDVTSVTLGQKSGSASGTTTVNGTLNIGGGTVTIGSGGILMGSNSATDTASTAAGTVNLTGGIVSVDGDIVHGGTTGGSRISSATLNLDGASLDMRGNDIGDAANPVTTVLASGTLSNVGELNGGGALDKTTSGTLTLEGTNTYSGPTTVSEGILLVNADNSGATGNVTVASSATLGGTGIVGGSTTVSDGGYLAPGSNPGTLAFANGLTLNSGATWLVDLTYSSSPANGTTHDFVDATGTLGLNNSLLVVNDTGSFVWGSEYQIARYGNWAGDVFSNGSYVTGSGGGQFLITYGDGGDDFILLTAVPEPESILPLAAVLLAALGLVRRRRRGARSQAC